MSLAHQIVLSRRVATLIILWVEETSSSRVRIGSKVVVILTILSTTADETIVSWSANGTISIIIFNSAHRTTAISKPTSSVAFVWLVKSVGMAIGGGLSTATYSS